MEKLKLLDLFSGIGGFSLGLEASGYFEPVAFCEIDTFPQSVLARRFVGVPIYGDIRALTAERLRADGIMVDAICGGFPCQDISVVVLDPFGGSGTTALAAETTERKWILIERDEEYAEKAMARIRDHVLGESHPAPAKKKRTPAALPKPTHEIAQVSLF
ncbi:MULTISPECIES: DNA cytosine methyltransferase [unclassified Hyphomicrobium]|uniref:DNA cytosine methyltransferase n=1 Tax=unclassified Hyphomicrobium TaxID=2619925 RepID=UPI000213F447|nr:MULTISPECIES: DNA cytosine methyltransferase [unclassified Hyphomicrobium]CCB64934.1 protein of unknown function [Hyphomicrobium sp. MC1]